MTDLTAARVLADSASLGRSRLTTVEVTFPRFILAEFNTHRALSRNSASSRAIPVAKQLAKVRDTPFVPQRFPLNQPGMSADEYVGPEDDRYVELAQQWLYACQQAINAAEGLMGDGVHKQIASRLLEPFMWHTVIASATATAWAGFFSLRISEFAQPEIRLAAECIRLAIASSEPVEVDYGDWHLPLWGDEYGDTEFVPIQTPMVSAARCARVSYLTHDGRRDINEDVALAERLAESKHLSPFEHVAQPTPPEMDSRLEANFRGWIQLRRSIEFATS